ncbi:MAG: hypothetical protein U0X91_17930 [Spirosomataceae bacterium]
MEPLYRKVFKTVVIIHFALFFIGCTGKINTVKDRNYNLKSYKKAFIISAENSQYIKFRFGIITPLTYIVLPDKPPIKHKIIGETDLIIKQEVEKYGISAEIGNKESIPQDIDLIILYNDTWRWDFKKILDRLDIVFISPENKMQIAKSSFTIYQNKEFHNFPTPQKEVPKMIKELLDK